MFPAPCSLCLPMDLPDAEMVISLEARDGALGSRWRPHRRVEGACANSDLYPDGDCPWCAAEERRAATGALPSPSRSSSPSP